MRLLTCPASGCERDDPTVLWSAPSPKAIHRPAIAVDATNAYFSSAMAPGAAVLATLTT